MLALTGCYAPLQDLSGNPYLAGDVYGHGDVGGAPPLSLPNPLAVRSPNHELLWEGLVEVVEDYFRIRREDRVRRVGDVVVEGRIETYPVTGATVLEPWRKDSVGPRNRWESTFQSIRRIGFVRVIPSGNGYLVEVQVQKELEDLDRPERATAAAIQFRESLGQRSEVLSAPPVTMGWIGLGRDLALEQRILADLETYFGAGR